MVHSLDGDLAGHSRLDDPGGAPWVVEARGVGWLWWSSSGLTMLYRGGAVIVIGHARLRRPGRMPCMVTTGVILSGTTMGSGINCELGGRKTSGRCI